MTRAEQIQPPGYDRHDPTPHIPAPRDPYGHHGPGVVIPRQEDPR